MIELKDEPGVQPATRWLSGAVPGQNVITIALLRGVRGEGEHFVTLDKTIKTMRDTGADMKTSTARPRAAVSLST